MKNLRLGTFLVFAVFACWLPAQAQQWTYTGNNGTAEQAYINITQYSNGYGVSGAINRGGRTCTISGTYYPKSGQIRGRCTGEDGYQYNVDGAQRAGQDAFQLSMPITILLRRAGAGRAETGGGSSSGCPTGVPRQIAGKRILKKETWMVYEWWWAPGARGRGAPSQPMNTYIFVYYLAGGGTYKDQWSAYECEHQRRRNAGWEFQVSRGSKLVKVE